MNRERRLGANLFECLENRRLLAASIPAAPVNTWDGAIATRSDDAEERLDTGKMLLGSADLDIIREVTSTTAFDQVVGLRFAGLPIPRGALIQEAHIQFTADETSLDPASLILEGQAVDDAPTFTTAPANLSSRSRTATNVPWTPAPWTAGSAGPAQQTPNLAAIVQEIVDRPAWSSGNALAIIINGSGKRVAESFDGNLPLQAPLLHVEYTLPGGTISETGGSTAVAEGGLGDGYTVVLNTIPSANVNVTVTPDAQTDLGSGAGTAVVLSFTPANALIPQTVNVAAVDDAVVEGDHSSTITHYLTSSDANYNGLALPNVLVSISDNETTGVTIVISGGSTDVTEGGVSDSYDVVLNTIPAADVTVTATPDAQTDLGAGAGVARVLTFTPANALIAQTVYVTAVDDAMVEGAHSSTITHSASSSDANYNGLAILSVPVSISDNDIAGVTISQTGGSTDVTEGGASDSYTVVLDTIPTANVTITATPDAQTDLGGGAGVARKLTFTPFNALIPQTITVTAVDDGMVEGPHTSTITHTASSTVDLLDFRVLGDVPYSQAEYSQLEADLANVALRDAFFVHVGDIKDQASPCDETVYSSVAASLQTSSIPVFILPGDNEWNDCADPAQAWTYWDQHLMRLEEHWAHGLNVLRQSIREENFAFVDAGVLFIGLNLVGGSVHDPVEWAQRMIDDAEWVNENFNNFGSQVTSAVVFGHAFPDPTGGPRQAFAEEFVTTAQAFAKPILYMMGDDHAWLMDHPYTDAPNVTRVTVDNGVPSVRVTLTADPNDPFTFDQNPTSMPDESSVADGNYHGLTVPAVTVNVTDNDTAGGTAGVTLVASGGSTDVTEGGSADSYTVVLDTIPAADVTVTVTPDTQTDLGSGPGMPRQLTFTPANARTPQTVIVTAVNDLLVEGPHVSTLVHTASSTDPNYSGLSINNIVANITDNDTATFTINDVTVGEGAGTLTFTVSLDRPLNIPLTVDVSFADVTAKGGGTDYISTTQHVNFLAGDTTGKTVAVPITNDNLVEATETFTASLSTATPLGGRAVNLSDTGMGSITDDDTPTAKFLVVDRSADATFRYQANGAYLSRANLAKGNTDVRGVAAKTDGSRLWAIDNNRTVYVYDAAMTLLGSWSPSGLDKPTGIAVVGTDLWIVDRGRDRAYLFAGASTRLSGSVAATRSFALNSGNNESQDLATDGTTIWVTQTAKPGKVFVYQASNGANLGNWTIDTANASPVGLALDPTGASTSLWIVDNKTDRVYEYADGRARRSGVQAASASFALNSANSDPQGIVDPYSAVNGSAQPARAKSATSSAAPSLPDVAMASMPVSQAAAAGAKGRNILRAAASQLSPALARPIVLVQPPRQAIADPQPAVLPRSSGSQSAEVLAGTSAARDLNVFRISSLRALRSPATVGLTNFNDLGHEKRPASEVVDIVFSEFEETLGGD